MGLKILLKSLNGYLKKLITEHHTNMQFSTDNPPSSQRVPVFAKNVVATSQPIASQAGLEMLQSGGNAVDAALAAAITLTIVEPTGNGLGSDAFAIIWDGKKLHGLNGSGRSPAGWSSEHFANYQTMPELGWDAVTVPGGVGAWSELSRRFGKLPFMQLFEPAIRYAEEGFLVTPTIAFLWADAAYRFEAFPEFTKVFLPEGKAPEAGDLFISPQQARTLKKIAETGGETFYKGEIAQKITAHAKATGGIMKASDLAAHKAEWVEPISQAYHGIEMHEIPPNGQGLAALIALGLLRQYDIQDYLPDSADSIHLQVEAMKIAFAEAHRYISDPAAMEIKPQALLVDSFLAKRAEEICMDRALYPKASIPNEKGTVYLAAADDGGMMVSYIQSNYMGFGSGIVIPGTGVSLQNRGNGFSLKAGHPNQVDGGKRPYHTIIPAFVTRNHQPVLSFGVMGGHMQPQGHVQMVTRIFDYGFNPQEASNAPRWCLTEDFELALEAGIGDSVTADLVDRGHKIIPNPPVKLFGGAQLIAKIQDGYCAASDHRKDGQAVGY